MPGVDWWKSALEPMRIANSGPHFMAIGEQHRDQAGTDEAIGAKKEEFACRV